MARVFQQLKWGFAFAILFLIFLAGPLAQVQAQQEGDDEDCGFNCENVVVEYEQEKTYDWEAEMDKLREETSKLPDDYELPAPPQIDIVVPTDPDTGDDDDGDDDEAKEREQACQEAYETCMSACQKATVSAAIDLYGRTTDQTRLGAVMSGKMTQQQYRDKTKETLKSIMESAQAACDAECSAQRDECNETVKME